MTKQTAFLAFWRELSHLPLGLAWRVWKITNSPAEATRIVAPWSTHHA